MYLLFVASPVKLGYSLDISSPFPPANSNNYQTRKQALVFHDSEQKIPYQKELIMEQLKKVNTEIQARNNQEYAWFQLKYYLIGGLVLGFLTNTFFKKETQESIFYQLRHALESPATSLLLALSVIVAITIDVQIRFGRNFMMQLGSWVSNYIEPIFLGDDIVGWEQFLRLQGSYHVDIVTASFVSSNVYLLTIIMYAFYLYSTNKAYSKINTPKASEERIEHPKNFLERGDLKIVDLGFWMLQICLLFCCISSHLVPSNFIVSPFPLITGLLHDEIYVNSIWTVPIYLLLWVHELSVAVLVTKMYRKKQITGVFYFLSLLTLTIFLIITLGAETFFS